jgi:hypothetical protein
MEIEILSCIKVITNFAFLHHVHSHHLITLQPETEIPTFDTSCQYIPCQPSWSKISISFVISSNNLSLSSNAVSSPRSYRERGTQ